MGQSTPTSVVGTSKASPGEVSSDKGKGHKCHKSQLYQLVIEVSSDGEIEPKSLEADEFQDYNEQLEQGE
ncbi:hypothetical protein PVK06_035583 [Gossypium arboreum]|uniref:Uncharacterized protein n=1 Tax=Gossypium arboreum TaxID=29729 RepID=A0ABR0NIC8_GOSAR|nr:hypothetical protein PVK06_035583 [Gossypium arboreum]